MKYLYLIFKIKFSFKIGQQVDLLIWTGWENKEIFNNIFRKLNFSYIERPTDVLNLTYFTIALILKFIKGGNLFINYFRVAIYFTKPKFLLTTYDNYPIFYKFKKYFNVKTGFVQNGHRFPYKDYLYDNDRKIKINKKSNFVDHMFVYGKNIQKELENHIHGNFHTIGSFRNNFASRSKQRLSKNNKSIVFISQFRPHNPQKAPIPDGKILKSIDKYCKKKNLNLKIMCFSSPFIKGRAKKNFQSELNYYKNLRLKNNYKILIRNNFYDSYRILSKENLIITENSALGYEMLAIGKKVIFFSIRNDDFSPKGANRFAWPLKSGKSGPFWLNYYSPQIFFNKIEQIRSMSKLRWIGMHKKYIRNIISFDYKNKILVKIIKKEINEYKKNSQK